MGKGGEHIGVVAAATMGGIGVHAYLITFVVMATFLALQSGEAAPLPDGITVSSVDVTPVLAAHGQESMAPPALAVEQAGDSTDIDHVRGIGTRIASNVRNHLKGTSVLAAKDLNAAEVHEAETQRLFQHPADTIQHRDRSTKHADATRRTRAQTHKDLAHARHAKKAKALAKRAEVMRHYSRKRRVTPATFGSFETRFARVHQSDAEAIKDARVEFSVHKEKAHSHKRRVARSMNALWQANVDPNAPAQQSVDSAKNMEVTKSMLQEASKALVRAQKKGDQSAELDLRHDLQVLLDVAGGVTTSAGPSISPYPVPPRPVTSDYPELVGLEAQIEGQGGVCSASAASWNCCRVGGADESGGVATREGECTTGVPTWDVCTVIGAKTLIAAKWRCVTKGNHIRPAEISTACDAASKSWSCTKLEDSAPVCTNVERDNLEAIGWTCLNESGCQGAECQPWGFPDQGTNVNEEHHQIYTDKVCTHYKGSDCMDWGFVDDGAQEASPAQLEMVQLSVGVTSQSHEKSAGMPSQS